ncbi:MAG: hypothetical protein IPK69_04730 [Phycisphaerales bacterium]|nr:MAG: hypothetical protein IPK69_04730 [Phycisphaerales bacterium]
MNTRRRFVLASVVIFGSAATASAQTAVVAFDDPGNFHLYDQTATAAPSDGQIRFRANTFSASWPGPGVMDADFFYGFGSAGPGVTGVESPISYVTLTNVLVRRDPADQVPGAIYGFQSLSFSMPNIGAIYPQGIQVGAFFTGSLVDFDNDGFITGTVLLTTNIDGGLGNNALEFSVTNAAVVPGGSIPFSMSALAGPNSAEGFSLGLGLSWSVQGGDGFELPGSAHAIAIEGGTGFNPQVPAPASLAVAALGITAVTRRRRSRRETR